MLCLSEQLVFFCLNATLLNFNPVCNMQKQLAEGDKARETFTRMPKADWLE